MKNKILPVVALLLALTSCDTPNPSTPSTPSLNPSVSEQPSVVEPENNPVEEAVAKLKQDLKVVADLENSRTFINPWFSENNFKRTYRAQSQYVTKDEGKYTFTTAELKQKTDTGYNDMGTVKGGYENDSKIEVEEVLNHRNERVVSRITNYSNSNFYKIDASSVLYNSFKDIHAGEFIETEQEGVYTYTGSALAYFAYGYLGYSQANTTATFKLEEGKFTRFEANFEKEDSIYVSSTTTAHFRETLSLVGVLVYEGATYQELQPVETNKVTEIDNILEQYKNTSYTVQSINPDMFSDGASIQAVYDEDGRIAIDGFDLFSEGELNTLSYLDARLEKEEGGDRYFLNNLALNEETYEYFWQSTEETIEAAGVTLIDEKSIWFEEDQFQLDFTNIDTSLLTLKEGETKIYEVNPLAVKHFGEAIVPQILDYGAWGMMFQPVVAFTKDATSWTIEILDNNDLYFVCDATYSLNGAQINSGWGFILTGAGTSSCDAFYTDDLPSLM